MTSEEARIYFAATDEEDLENELLTELFKHKNFFIGTSPIPKVFLSRIKKLNKIQEAYIAVGGVEENSDYSKVSSNYDAASLGETFREYNSLRSTLKQRIMASNNIDDIKNSVLNLLEETRLYARVWNFEYDNMDGVLVSNEMDQMNVLNQIKKLEAFEPITIEAIQKLDSENVLVRESKRLSLWLKLDQNV
ncbi:MAG: hypothetical protein HRT57_00020 [Crocinitomicaceae bacterium]|nr:hypothetical protein [Crocinitomicaceae bacterium]